jgi:signal transduction histidine kinase
MTFKYSLRFRVAAICSLVGLVVGLMAVANAYVWAERMEQDLVSATLGRTLDGILASDAPTSSEDLPSDIRFFPPAREWPQALHGLAPGLHEVQTEDQSLQTLVRDHEGQRYLIVWDETANERREDRLFVLSLLLLGGAVVVASALGYYSARAALFPVEHLAGRLRELGPGEPGTAMAPSYAHTEIGEIAEAFDHYRERLHEFIEREREFTADASHELRTPLATIQGAAELLRAPNVTAERQAGAAKRIERAATQMAELLSALLLLAREQPGSPDHEGAVVRVDHVVVDLVDGYRPVARRKGLRIELHVDEPVEVEGEAVLLSIVINNLLDTALAHTSAGSITVNVETHSVRIADTGEGIAERDIPYIFERRYRGSGRDNGPGAGIGLSIARRVCDRYGWTLCLESAPGLGSVATLTFGPPVSNAACSR